MIFEVEFTMNNCDCLVEVDAADLETAKKAVNQWRVTKLRHTNNKIKVTKISTKNELATYKSSAIICE